MKQAEIYEKIESLLPHSLWEKYKHLSFAEMAEIPELSAWKKEFIDAEKLWFDAEDA